MNINQVQNNAMLNSVKNFNNNENVNSSKSDTNFKFELNKKDINELNHTEQMELMIQDIEQVQEKIEADLTVENVMKYKELVASFLKYYTENVLTLETLDSQNGKYGYREKLTVVKKVEEGVREIEDMMSLLETKSGHLEMLKKIGEINGLVLDLKL